MKALWTLLMTVLALGSIAEERRRRQLETRPAPPPPPNSEPSELVLDLSHYPPYLLSSFHGPAIPRA